MVLSAYRRSSGEEPLSTGTLNLICISAFHSFMQVVGASSCDWIHPSQRLYFYFESQKKIGLNRKFQIIRAPFCHLAGGENEDKDKEGAIGMISSNQYGYSSQIKKEMYEKETSTCSLVWYAHSTNAQII